MTTDPRDPDYDDSLYCERCLHLIDEQDQRDMGDDPDEEHDCPYCHKPLTAIGPEAMREERAIRKADWDAAHRDGLIR